MIVGWELAIHMRTELVAAQNLPWLTLERGRHG